MPIAALQGQTRGKLFIDKGVHAVVYNKRVDFTGKKSPTFGNVWLMWNPEGDIGFNVPTGNNLVFIDN